MKLVLNILFAWVLFCILWAADAFGQSDIQEIWALDDGERVQRDENSHFMQTSASNAVWKNARVNIFGAKNEVVSFQLVLEAGATAVSQVGVYLDSLNHYPTDWALKDSSWSGDEYDFVGKRIETFVAAYKNVTTRSITGGTVIANGSLPLPDSLYTGWMPDALIPSTADTTGTAGGKIGGMPFLIPANMNQTVWFDIYIPKHAPAGYFNGDIRITEGGVQTRTISVQLVVHSFTLSDTTHFPVALNLHSKNTTFGYTLGLPNDSDTLYGAVKKFMRMMHRHRINVTMGLCNYSRFTTTLGSHYTGDYYVADSLYDGPGVGVGDNVWAIGPMEIPIKSSATYQSTPSSVIYQPTASWGSTNQTNWVIEADRWEDWFLNNASHVRRYKYIADEPFNFDWDLDGTKNSTTPYDVQDTTVQGVGIRTLAEWLRGSAGNGKYLGRMVTGTIWEGSTDRLDGSVNNLTFQATPGYHGTFGGNITGIHARTDPALAYRQPNNKELGLYNNMGVKTENDTVSLYNGGWPSWGAFGIFDLPTTAPRLMMWTAWRYQQYIDYIWLWSTVYRFDQNYGGDFWTEAANDLEDGLSTQAYFGRSAVRQTSSRGLDGMIASVRLKNIRRGLQDFEYLHLAQTLGVLDTNIAKTVIPRALDFFDSTSTPQYKNFSQIPFSIRGHEYESARASLAALLDTTSYTVQGTLSASDTSLPSPASVSLRWTSILADSARLVRSGMADSAISVSDTSDFYFSVTQPISVKWYGVSDSVEQSLTIYVGGSPVEQIANVSWEDSTGGWTYYDNSSPTGTYDRQASSAYHGSYRGRVVLPASYNGGTPNVQLYSKQFAMTAGNEYRVRAHIRGSSASSVRVQLTNNTGANLGLKKTYSFVSGSWTTIDTTVVATASISNAFLQFLFRLSATTYTTAGITFYVDSVSVVEPETTAIGVPVWNSPQDGWTNVANPVSFSWYSVSGATEYTLSVDNNSDFSSPEILSNELGSTSYTLTSSTTFYARLRAITALGYGPWSDTITFSSQGDVPQSTPTLSTPTAGAINQTRSPLLDWTDVQDAGWYEVHITRDTTTAVDTSETTSSSWIILGSSTEPRLEYSTRYYWRVQAGNTNGGGSWTPWRVFETGSRIGLAEHKRARVRITP